MASMYDETFLERLKSKLSLSDVARRFFKIERAGREFKALCPFHKESTPSFHINDAKGFYHCFGCSAHGDALSLLMHVENRSFVEAVERLAEWTGTPLPAPIPRYDSTSDSQTPDSIPIATWQRHMLATTAQYYHQYLMNPDNRLAAEARDYASRRGFSPKTITDFTIGLSPEGNGNLNDILAAYTNTLPDTGGKPVPANIIRPDAAALSNALGLSRTREDGSGSYAFFRGRLMIPVHDAKGRMIAFGGRILHGEGAKYINSPDHPLFQKSDVVFNHHRVLDAVQKPNITPMPILIVEGYVDVISLHQHGYPFAIAPMGTALTESQMQIAWNLGQRLSTAGTRFVSQKSKKATPQKSTTIGLDTASLESALAEGVHHNAAPVLCFDGDAAGLAAADRAIERLLPLLSPTQSLQFCFLPEGDDPDSFVRREGRMAFLEWILQRRWPLEEALWRFSLAGKPLNTPEEQVQAKRTLLARAQAIPDMELRRIYEQRLKDRFEQTFASKRQSSTFQKNIGNAAVGNGGASRWNGGQVSKHGTAFNGGIGLSGQPKPPKSLRQIQEHRGLLVLTALLSHPTLLLDMEETIIQSRILTPLQTQFLGTVLNYIADHDMTAIETEVGQTSKNLWQYLESHYSQREHNRDMSDVLDRLKQTAKSLDGKAYAAELNQQDVLENLKSLLGQCRR